MRRCVNLFLSATLPAILTGCFSQALPTGDAQRACQQLPQMRQRINCFTDLAQAEDDIWYCNYIVDSGFRVTCKTEFAKAKCDASYCSDIEETWKRPGCEATVQSWINRDKCTES